MKTVISINSHRFIHNGLDYTFKWTKNTLESEFIVQELKNKIKCLYNFILSDNFPNQLFNDRSITRCSNFRVKHLQRGAQKKISLSLIHHNHVLPFSAQTQPNQLISESIINLTKTAQSVYENYPDNLGKKPGHEPILTNILCTDNNALSVETPIWAFSKSDKRNFNYNKKKFPNLKMITANTSFTGHIDLLLYNPIDESLVVVDYKPERNYIRSIPQVAIYGLMIKKLLDYSNVKCVSFSKEDGWLYNPEIIQEIIPHYLETYGNPDLPWLYLRNSF